MSIERLLPRERRIVELIDAEEPYFMAHLERLVRIPSATSNSAGVAAVSDIVRSELQALGFKCSTCSDYAHLIADRPSIRGVRVLLIGHMDTVLETEFAVSGNIATGGGVVDMKGGLVVMIAVLKALHASGDLDRAQLSIWLASDEEGPAQPTSASRASLLLLAHSSDVALGFETGVAGTLTVARRGISAWTLTVTAKSGHSASVGTELSGYGAIYEAARIVNAMRSLVNSRTGIVLNPSHIAGGMSIISSGTNGFTTTAPSGAIAETAEIRGDLRYTSEEQRAETEARLREILAEPLAHTQSAVAVEEIFPAMQRSSRTDQLLADYNRASHDLGFGHVVALAHSRRGAADTSFAAQYVPAVDGLGPFGGNAHTALEFCLTESIALQAKRAAIFLARYIDGGASP